MSGSSLAAAEKIWEDLTDRSGFSDDVDAKTAKEIIDCWAAIIEAEVEEDVTEADS